MVSDEIYELCVPILQDEAVDEDEQPERVQELLQKETDFTGKALEEAVLDVLWKYRAASNTSASPPPARHTVIRRASPAPWQVPRTPTPANSSPRLGFGIPPGFARAKSSTASPFTSPRPSPRLAFSSPHIPHSPSLSAYTPADPGLAPEAYENLNSETIDWLINDDTGSTASSSGPGETGLNGAAAEWMPSSNTTMNTYELLRSILGDDRSDEDIEKVLQETGYDLNAAIPMLMGQQPVSSQQTVTLAETPQTFIVGKSMSPSVRPVTPQGQAKSNILCKYFLQNGQCARADCRFSHDPSKTLCK
jgi:hypothetical protein